MFCSSLEERSLSTTGTNRWQKQKGRLKRFYLEAWNKRNCLTPGKERETNSALALPNKNREACWKMRVDMCVQMKMSEHGWVVRGDRL